MNVFTRDSGLHQGRIAAPTPNGAFVYELGHAKLADSNVRSGDFHEITQTFTKIAGSKFLQASVVITTPSILPAVQMWEVSAWLNGVRMVSRRLRPSKRKITLSDWKISLLDANEAPLTNVLAFRLELIDG